MTSKEEMQALTDQWKSEGWNDAEIESSLISYFTDSPTFVDDAGDE